MSQIRGKTVLITGGSSGIGYLMGRLVLEKGAKRLIIWGRRRGALDDAVRDFRSSGFDAVAAQVDVADLAQVREAAKALVEGDRSIDILINNAGIVVGKNFSDHTHEDIDRTIRVNTLAPMHLTRALLPAMLERKSGHIVNIASASGLSPVPGISVYSGSKWAAIGWSESLRIEMERARSGVRVTTVAPYYIDTGMFADVQLPILPILKPEDVARAVVEAIKKDKILVRLPRSLDLLPLLRGMLPARWFDRICGEWMGIYDSMRTFKGRGE